ncbi:MAG: pyridoxal phosphate-dependent aminotransferase family protein [Cyclobacteriaceae bacterium]
MVSNHDKHIHFSGNNYLGLANNQEIVEKVSTALREYGNSFSASRRTTGTHDIHLQLEKLLSEFKQSEQSMVFATGYLGNSLLVQALRKENTLVLADAQSHPSIIDSIPSDLVSMDLYAHRDCDHLETLLKKHEPKDLIIMTDGVFALTGEIAPLDSLHELAIRYGATLIVDDAHATGVLGENGRGTPEHFRLHGSNHIYQSETMSKALGSYGGFIAADTSTIEKIRSDSSFYVASTALPPAIVLASLFSLQYLKKHPELRVQLLHNAKKIKDGVTALGFATTRDHTPIIPLFFKAVKQAEQLSQYLEKMGSVVPAIKYPIQMEQSIVRITTNALHTSDEIEQLLFTLKKWTNEHPAH